MPMIRPWDDERGIALVLAMFLTVTMSVLAASLMFLSQTETYASLNYRLMSQARYGAESGVHKAVNYLLNTYVPPSTAGADLLTSYDMTKSPVQYMGAPVILSANAAVASNYPVAAVQNAFNPAGQGTLAAGTGTVNYQTYATMLSMQQVNGGQTVITWQITSDGTITAGRTATVEVSSILEKQLVPQPNAVYAAFAQAGTCGALTFSGQAVTNSYDSTSALVGGVPVLSNSSGNLGTNGNLNENNASIINGTLSTPRVGVGNCNNGNVDALSSSGGATVTGGVIHLSQNVVPPTPPMPNPWVSPFGNTTFTDVGGCHAVVGCSAVNATQLRFAPGNYGDVHTTNTATIHLTAGTYNINSLIMDNATTLTIDSGPVVINIVGAGVNGNSNALFINSSVTTDPARPFDPTMLTFNYAGTARVQWNNQATSVVQLNAPNATVDVNSSVIYGSVIGNTVSFNNAAQLHFDRHLSTLAPSTFQVGNDMMTSFTWKKF